MRAYERQPGETQRAFDAFKVYRDLGAERSLARAAEIYYGSSTNRSQLGVWSRKHDWVARAAQRDDYIDMIRRQAVEDHAVSAALERAEREERLRDLNLTNDEKAAEVSRLYLDAAQQLIEQLPLVTQTTVREPDPDNPDLQPGVYIIQPATKNPALDAARLHRMATRAEGRARSAPAGPGEDELEPAGVGVAQDEQEQVQRERDPEVFDAEDALWEAQERARARREGETRSDWSS